MTAIKTKIIVGLIRKLMNSADQLIESQEALVTVLVENTKVLQRIEKLLDEQADIQADTRDAVASLPQTLEVVTDE